MFALAACEEWPAPLAAYQLPRPFRSVDGRKVGSKMSLALIYTFVYVSSRPRWRAQLIFWKGYLLCSDCVSM